MPKLNEYFLLDPEITFLNHGSFGATPRPVFAAYQKWQRKLEWQPVQFLGRDYDHLLLESRAILGEYVNSNASDLVYIPNATYGVNIVARSLDLKPGDEVLTSDHEYGACDYTWDYLCGKTGAKYVHQQISLPVNSEDEMVDQFWTGFTPQTKVIFLSHITSPTALRLPVEKICRRAHQFGITTLVDGAHAMGQIPLDLEAIGADFYTSNCHKWSLAPKGAAFLYARKEVQPLIEPLVVSWGYENDPQHGSGSRFIDLLQWTGTRDPAAALTVPEAIRFMARFDWENVRQECHVILRDGIVRICDLTGLPPAYPLDSNLFIQMGIAPLPATTDLVKLKSRLYDEYKVEVPVTQLGEHKFLRISVQCYNTKKDIDILISALNKLGLGEIGKSRLPVG
jgi:isopenicillin-N epimerase